MQIGEEEKQTRRNWDEPLELSLALGQLKGKRRTSFPFYDQRIAGRKNHHKQFANGQSSSSMQSLTSPQVSEQLSSREAEGATD